jgi:hypothetical protein
MPDRTQTLSVELTRGEIEALLRRGDADGWDLGAAEGKLHNALSQPEHQGDKVEPANCGCEYPCSCVSFRGKRYNSRDAVIEALVAGERQLLATDDRDVQPALADRLHLARDLQQLLEAIEAHRIEPLGEDCAADQALYKLADQIKSKEGGDADADLGGDRGIRATRRHATRGGSDQVDGVAPEQTSSSPGETNSTRTSSEDSQLQELLEWAKAKAEEMRAVSRDRGYSNAERTQGALLARTFYRVVTRIYQLQAQ